MNFTAVSRRQDFENAGVASSLCLRERIVIPEFFEVGLQNYEAQKGAQRFASSEVMAIMALKPECWHEELKHAADKFRRAAPSSYHLI
jgi:hypothetical protein